MSNNSHLSLPEIGFVRIAPLSAIPELLCEMGIDPGMVFQSCGIADENIFDDPNALLPFTVAGRLLNECARTTGVLHFGLLVGQRAKINCLGAVGLLLCNSTDVMSALFELVVNLDIHQHGSTTFLNIVGERAVLGYEVYVSGVPGVEHIYDCAVAFGWTIMRTLCGNKWVPIEVCLRHDNPVDMKPYLQFFKAPIRFNSSQSCLVFSAHWLSHTLQLASSTLREQSSQTIAQLRKCSVQSFKEQVHRVVVMLLGQQRCTRDSLADCLGMHPRTMTRRLKESGTNFRELHVEASHEMACQLLRDTRRSIPAIAAILGYSDATAFSRSFSKRERVTPSKWRKTAIIDSGARDIERI